MNTVRTIINADDLGCATDVNRAIFDLIDRGRVTSATLMANAPALEEAARELKRFPRASFGVHLNLTDFSPLAPTPGLAPLLGADGCFNNNIRGIRLNGGAKQAILTEWCAQIDRLRALGVTLSHFDSHHHVHTIAGLFPVLKTLQSRYVVRKVRLTRNLYDAGQKLRPGLRPAKGVWNMALRHIYATRTTETFTSLASFHSQVSQGYRPAGTIELMVHPGNKDFVDETSLLAGPWIETVEPKLELISYHDL
ncbi:MAG: ChbG/HpnK family deacetylase [Reyranellaceae bacterium]